MSRRGTVDSTPRTTVSWTPAEVAECEKEVEAPEEYGGPTDAIMRKACGSPDGTDGVDRPGHMLMVLVHGL
jgi:hypothetical protein